MTGPRGTDTLHLWTFLGNINIESASFFDSVESLDQVKFIVFTDDIVELSKRDDGQRVIVKSSGTGMSF